MKKKFMIVVIIMISCICFYICWTIFISHPRIIEPRVSTNPIIFRLAETKPSNHPSTRAAEYFASLVDERSQGRIKIKVYDNEELGTPKEILEQVQFGGIAMAQVNVLDLTEIVHSLQYYFKPQSYESGDSLIQWIQENNETLMDDCQMERILPLVWYYPDIRCFYSDEESFRKVSDLKNMKIKTTPCTIMKNTMETLGCSAVEIITADTYKSLSTGYMDAGETTLSEFIFSDYYNFVNYITLSQYIACPDVMVVSTIAFTMLEKPERELIIQCAKDTYEYQKKLLKQFQETWILQLEKEKQLFIEDELFKKNMKSIFSQEKAAQPND